VEKRRGLRISAALLFQKCGAYSSKCGIPFPVRHIRPPTCSDHAKIRRRRKLLLSSRVEGIQCKNINIINKEVYYFDEVPN